MGGKRSALLISTSLYEDEAFRQLQSPAADVAELRNILENPEIGAYEVELLSDKASHEVNRAIDEFFAGASVDDLVFLYFSGHGYRDPGSQLFMVTRDSHMMVANGSPALLESTAVSAQFVRNKLERCRSRRKIVILDCCHAGAFPAGATKDAGNVDVLGEFAGRGSAVMTASSALQYALETDGDRAFSEVGEKAIPSVFTGALIEGIVTGNADLNGDGIIDFDELYKHVYDQVTLKAPHQTPQKQSDVAGSLFITKSPLGPRPIPLFPEITQALLHPLPDIKLTGIKVLVESCSHAHPGMILAARHALSELTKDDSNKVAKAARVAMEQLDQFFGQKTAGSPGQTQIDSSSGDGESHSTSTRRASELQHGTAPDDLVTGAERNALAIIAAARYEADDLMATAERDAARLRTTTDDEVAEKRAATERDMAKLRTTTEREVAQLKAAAERQEAERLLAAQSAARKLASEAELRASAADQRAADASAQADQIRLDSDRTRREADEYARRVVSNANKGPHQIVAQAMAQVDHEVAKLRTTTEREVAQLKAAAKQERVEILTTSKRQADEMRSQAQRILEESEAQRAQDEAEFEIQLAARREEAERQEAERLSAAQAATLKLVSEAEQRASTAEQRAAKASAQADQTRRDADQHARQLVSNAKKNADQIVAQAQAQAERRQLT